MSDFNSKEVSCSAINRSLILGDNIAPPNFESVFVVNSGEETVENDGKDINVQEMLQRLEAEHAAQKQV